MTDMSIAPETILEAYVREQNPTTEQTWRAVDALKREHKALVEHERRGLERKRLMGEALIKLKPSVGHGHWEDYVEVRLGFKVRTAELYMRLARRWPEIEAECRRQKRNVTDLTLSGAMFLLTDGRVEDEDKTDGPDREPEKKKKREKYPPLIKIDRPLRFACPHCHHEWVGDPLAGQQEEEQPAA